MNLLIFLPSTAELLFSQLLVFKCVCCSYSWMLVLTLRALLLTVEKITMLRPHFNWLQQQVSYMQPWHATMAHSVSCYHKISTTN